MLLADHAGDEKEYDAAPGLAAFGTDCVAVRGLCGSAARCVETAPDIPKDCGNQGNVGSTEYRVNSLNKNSLCGLRSRYEQVHSQVRSLQKAWIRTRCKTILTSILLSSTSQNGLHLLDCSGECASFTDEPSQMPLDLCASCAGIDACVPSVSRNPAGPLAKPLRSTGLNNQISYTCLF